MVCDALSVVYGSMPKKVLTLAVIVLLLNLVCKTSAAANSKSKEAEFEAKVRTAVAQLGTGREARVEVKLHDKRKLRGYISEAGEDSFFVVDEKTGVATHVTYSQVKQVKGQNNFNGKKVALALAVIAFLTLIAVLQFNCNKNC